MGNAKAENALHSSRDAHSSLSSKTIQGLNYTDANNTTSTVLVLKMVHLLMS